MNRDVMDGRMERELRRRHLAMRLIHHQARTQTIEGLTGLTRHQLATLRRRAGVPTDSRYRGPAPTSFEVFFSSARMRNESTVLALLYSELGASRFAKDNSTSDSAIVRGERLCDVYELWRQRFPHSQIVFEQFTLLGEGVTQGEQICFGYCESCRALLLVDLLGNQRRLCAHCTRARRGDAARLSISDHRPDEETDLVLYWLQLFGGKLMSDRQGACLAEDDLPGPN